MTGKRYPDGFADFLMPLQQGGFSDGFRQLRNFNFNNCHITLRFGWFERRTSFCCAVGSLFGKDKAFQL